MNRRDGIEERAEAFGDKDHPCCEGFNCYVCVADFTRTETATITAERDRLKEAMLELVDKAERLVGFCLYCDMDGLENASEPERTMLAPALAKAKALIDDNGDA